MTLELVHRSGEAPLLQRLETDWNEAALRYHRRILAAVLATGVRAARAEELVQSTWSMLIEAERDGRLKRVELPGLAIVQARYLALHEIRRGAMEQRLLVVSDELAARAADLRETPEAQLLAKEDGERLLRAIEQLPASSQRAFRLLYGDPPKTYAAAADVLGLSVQRVRQLASELRQQLRATLASEAR
jgi:RNA polymerase sigma factor (sigma-70 family)